MPIKITIPKYVKVICKKALKEKNLILKTKQKRREAKKIGIYSSIERAEYFIKNKYIEENKSYAIIRIYNRLKRCNTKQCKLIINLNGGKKFISFLSKIYKYKVYKKCNKGKKKHINKVRLGKKWDSRKRLIKLKKK